MDPNVTLADIREGYRAIIAEDASDRTNATPIHDPASQTVHQLAVDLALRLDVLDQWLSSGGFAPDEWAGKDGPHMTAKQALRIAATLRTSGQPIVRVDLGSFLNTPTNYLGVVYTYEDGRTLEGGIDRDGAQST